MLTSLILFMALRGDPAPVGDAPFVGTDSQILVAASVNGHPGNFIFDTGFGGDLVIDSSVDMGKPSGTTSLRDFVGEFQANTYDIKSLKLGTMNLTTKGKEAIAQEGVSNFSDSHHVDGLMGFSLIKDYVTTINFQDHKFVFYPQSMDISHWVPNNKTTFLVKMLPIGPRAIVLPVVTDSGKQMVMSLDTGNAFYATTHKDVLQRVGLWPQDKDAKWMSSSMVASGAVNSWQKQMNNLTIFGVPVKSSIWDIIDLPSADASSDGTVGYQFLKNFNITFDFQRRLVWLENFTGKVENQPEGQLGMAAAYSSQQGALIVMIVSDDGPAGQAGIQVGDKILSINNTDVSSISPLGIYKILRGDVGTKVTLSVSHNGFLKRVTLTRSALVNP